MNIATITTKHLRNDEHFQFHTEFKDIVLQYGAKKLKIAAQFNAYLTLYGKEDEGIKKIRKSAITGELHKADKARDEIWRGMIHMNQAMLRHFNPEVQAAARRLKVVFDTYGNVAQKPLNEQTSAVYNILQELQGPYAADAETASLTCWVVELKARNETFGQLMKDRLDEAVLKTDVVLREARALLDEAYHAITTRVNALAEVEGSAEYEQFIRTVNLNIEKYVTALHHHHHKKKAMNDEQGTMNDC